MQSGLAKTLFFEVHQRSPWLMMEKKTEGHAWPILDELLAHHHLTYLDYVLAHRLLREHSVEQEAALFICHLVMAAKEGHLCVKIEDNALFPTVAQLWLVESESSLSLEELDRLKKMILRGAKNIPSALITHMQTNWTEELPHTPLCSYQNCFYLQRHWIFETLFICHLKRHLHSIPSLQIEQSKILEQLNCLLQSGLLLEEQSQAILKGLLTPLSLITGGPGTGKTYTAGQLIQVFWSSLSEEQRKQCQIILAAPTGKAAANLQKSLAKVSSKLVDFPFQQAKTLHALLGIKSTSAYTKESIKRLNADLIIVDESSMVDVKMMACLFEALKKGSRLILLGDQHQLPSVEAGSVFVDLIQLPQTHPDLSIPCTQLKVCLRAELSSIITFAQTINQGQSEKALALLNQTSTPGISRLELPSEKKEAQRIFLNHVVSYFPSFIKAGQDVESILNTFNAIRILSPMRKGPFGVDAINQLLWQHISQAGQASGWLAIPILIVTNDYRQDLFNGETGILMRKMPLRAISAEDYALFPSRSQEESARRLSALLLPKYEYAYCLSVHKSQGSEFDRIILVLPEGAELFGREVFYTAVTRARKHVEVYGSDTVIHKTISQQGIRLSGIERRLMAGKDLN